MASHAVVVTPTSPALATAAPPAVVSSLPLLTSPSSSVPSAPSSPSKSLAKLLAIGKVRLDRFEDDDVFNDAYVRLLEQVLCATAAKNRRVANRVAKARSTNAKIRAAKVERAAVARAEAAGKAIGLQA